MRFLFFVKCREVCELNTKRTAKHLWMMYRQKNASCFRFYKTSQKEYTTRHFRRSAITLHGSSGKAIGAGDPVPFLVLGSYFANPLHIQVSADSLIPIKPAFDAELILFWSSLCDISEKDGFLYFPIRTGFFPENMKSLYIRNAYKDLFRINWRNLQQENPEKRFCRMVISEGHQEQEIVSILYFVEAGQYGDHENGDSSSTNGRGKKFIYFKMMDA
jgi:hypothetical protein